MSESCKYKRYLWELPVRWCHWVNMLCIVILTVTGFFIAAPFSMAHSASDFNMGWMRFIHFTTAYLFTLSVVSRVIWSFIGNRYAGWREFFPMASPDGRQKMYRMLRYYLLFDRQVPETIGHNPLATTAYFLLFLIYILMILTGFAMYAEYAPGGIMHKSLGFMYYWFSFQGMRLVHHFCTWLIFGFVINHIYSAWLMDIKERGGEISSMFSGFKFTVEKDD